MIVQLVCLQTHADAASHSALRRHGSSALQITRGSGGGGGGGEAGGAAGGNGGGKGSVLAGDCDANSAAAIAQEFMQLTRDKMQQFMLAWVQEKVHSQPCEWIVYSVVAKSTARISSALR